MSRIDFSALPLSADQARAARNYFAWSQAVAAEKSGLPIHKLKRFETGNYVPDEAFLASLRSFYEANGYIFDDTEKPGANARQAGLVFPAGVVCAPNPATAPPPGRRIPTTIHHMRIALTSDAEMGEILDMIEANEERAQALLRAPLESGFFGGITDATEHRHAQVIRLMADNGVLFSRLFGRDIGGSPSPEILSKTKRPSSGADLLHSVQADIHLAAKGDNDAKARQRESLKPAASVREAIGLS